MSDFIIAVVCLLLALLVVVLRKAYFALPLYELKRRATRNEQFARAVYPVVSYDSSLRGLLWTMLGIFSAVALVLFARLAPVWLGIGLVAAWLWLAFSWLPNNKTTKLSQDIAVLVTPFLAWVLHHTFPVIQKLGKLSRYYGQPHTGLYESEDLHRVLTQQENQADNRIAVVQLGRVKKLLAFEAASVADYFRPWEEIVKLTAGEPIGPKLLDDLHRSGQTTFPVTKTKSNQELVGILNKEDVGLKSQGLVRDHMRLPPRTINQEETMESALAQFSLSGQVFLIVVDNDQQISGGLSLKDALSSLLLPLNSSSGAKRSPEKPPTLDSEGDIHEST